MCVPDILVTDTFLAVKQQMHDLQMCVPDILVTHALYPRKVDHGKNHAQEIRSADWGHTRVCLPSHLTLHSYFTAAVAN